MSRLLWSLGALVVAVTVAEPAWAVEPIQVPEPGTMSILGAALAAVAIAARRRR